MSFDRKINRITKTARSIASVLSYNEIDQAPAKHALIEMANLLDSLDVRAHKKSDGLLLIDGTGRCRYATLLENILYRLFGSLPRQI